MSRRIAVVLAGLLACLVALAVPATAKDQGSDVNAATPVADSSPDPGSGPAGPTSGDAGSSTGQDSSGGGTKDKPNKPSKPKATQTPPTIVTTPSASTPTNRATQAPAPAPTASRSTPTGTDQPRATAAPAPVSTGTSTVLPAPNPMLLPESATYAAPVNSKRASPLSGLLPVLLVAAALASMAVGGVLLRRRGLLQH